MPVRNIVILLAVIALGAGGYLYAKGGLKIGKEGIRVDTSKVDQPELDPYTKGETLYRVFEYEAALAAFRQGLKTDADSSAAPMARYRTAECLKKLKKEREALKHYQLFLRKHPRHRMAPKAQKWVTYLESTL